MNDGDADDDFESELRRLTLRRPPAEWRGLLVPPLVPPPFAPVRPPWPLCAFLAVCWVATAYFVLSKPEDERLNLPMLPAPAPGASSMGEAVLTYSETPPR